MTDRPQLADAQRIVVKVGSSLVTNGSIALAGGRHLDEIRLEEAGGDVTTLSFSHTRLADALSPEESRLLTTP